MLRLISFYKFVKIKSPIDNKLTFKKFLIDNKLKGSIIFSLEGINGSVSGKQSNIDLLIKFLKERFLFKEFDTINECDVDFDSGQVVEMLVHPDQTFDTANYDMEDDKILKISFESVKDIKDYIVVDHFAARR